jgi:predicted nucleic acid-binding protein
MPRVFIETTIPSYYFETRSDRRAQDWRDQTRLWWSRYRWQYELVTSELVVAEFMAAPRAKSRQGERFFAELLALPLPAEFHDVVAEYISQRVMPADATGDAAHLAIASLYGIEFLLTWNCRHLANANKRQHIHVVNKRLGLSTPTITTPFELIPE